MHEMNHVNQSPLSGMADTLPNLTSDESYKRERGICFMNTPTRHRAIMDVSDGFRFGGHYIMRDIVLSGYGRSQVYQLKCIKCGKVQFASDLAPFCDHCLVIITTESIQKIIQKEPWRMTDEPVVGNIVGWIQKTEISDKKKKNSRHNFIKVYQRDKFICQYCGYNPRESTEFVPLHVDHIHPKIAGGTHKMENLVVACGTCNSIANDKIFNRFCNKWLFIRQRRKEMNLPLYDENFTEWKD